MKKLLTVSLIAFGLLNAKTVTIQEQIDSLKGSKQPTIVKVTASWCGPCRRMEPVMDKVKEVFKDKVDFKEFAVENLMKGNDEGVAALKKAFDIDITSIPTFLLFKDGKLVKMLIASRDEKNLTEWLNKLLDTKTEELLKEKIEDMPEIAGQSKKDLIQNKKEMEILKEFLTNRTKQNTFQEELLKSNTYQHLKASIEAIDKVLTMDLKDMPGAPSKEEFLKAKEETENLIMFIEDPVKHKELHAKILKTELFANIDQSIEALNKRIESAK